MVLLSPPEKTPPLPDVVARRRRIPTAAVAMLRESMTAGWVPASTPPIKDWDYKEERAMHDNVVLSLKEGRR
jgi:hypothetical protein